MNRILLAIGITTLIFIGACMVFAWHEKSVPDSLIYSYFGAIGAEGIVMGWIKNVKEKSIDVFCAKSESGKDDLYDRNNE